ncbi:MAG: low molecular weight phosphotyrosine protein phosphatase [Erysipelotrichaceae bacterium]|nr:low molecular weight phosphotyrosine protein phosphatase [Erysipelotrichaceae bacterium]
MKKDRKILFVCWGNICRSPMAEYILKSLSNDIYCESRAVSDEESGNDIYPPAKRCLERHGIPYERHHARKITQQDYEDFDEIYVMDELNRNRIRKLIDDHDHKIRMLNEEEIEDPWWTGRYDEVYDQIYEGILNILG